jgi:hypothetical protein
MNETENRRKELMLKAGKLSEIAGRIPSKPSEVSQQEEARNQLSKIMEEIRALGPRNIGEIVLQKKVTISYSFVQGPRKTNLIQWKNGFVPDDNPRDARVETDPKTGEPTKLYLSIISPEFQGLEEVVLSLKIVNEGEATAIKAAKISQRKPSEWKLPETWNCEKCGSMNTLEVASCIKCGTPRKEGNLEKLKGIFK